MERDEDIIAQLLAEDVTPSTPSTGTAGFLDVPELSAAPITPAPLTPITPTISAPLSPETVGIVPVPPIEEEPFLNVPVLKAEPSPPETEIPGIVSAAPRFTEQERGRAGLVRAPVRPRLSLAKQLEEQEKLAREKAKQRQIEAQERAEKEEITAYGKRRSPTGLLKKPATPRKPLRKDEPEIIGEPEIVPEPTKISAEEAEKRLFEPLEQGEQAIETFEFEPIPEETLEIIRKRLAQQEEIDRGLTVVGLVGMVCTGVYFADIYKLHAHLRNSYYHSTWRSLHMSLSNPRCGLVLYQRKGNLISMSAKSEKDMKLSLKKICVVLQKFTSQKIQYKTPLVLNVIKTKELGFQLILEGIEQDPDLRGHGISIMKTLEEQSEFPGKDFKDNNGILVTVFESGTVVFKVTRPKTEFQDIIPTKQIEIQNEYENRFKALEDEESKRKQKLTSELGLFGVELKRGEDEIEKDIKKKKEDLTTEHTVKLIEAQQQDIVNQREKEKRTKYSREMYDVQGFTIEELSYRINQTYDKIIPVLEKPQYRRQ